MPHGASRLGSLDFSDVISGPRVILYDPIPSTTVTSPVNDQLLTSTAPFTLTGTSNADCSVDELASPTNIGAVQFRAGTVGAWTNVAFTTTPDGCLGAWSHPWSPPNGLDNQTVTLQFRTVSIHGPSFQRDLFTQTVPTMVQVRVNTPFNVVKLITPGAIRSETFPVSWSIDNVNSVQAFALEYSLDGTNWGIWQTNQSGNDTFGLGLTPALAPGSKVYFRARVIGVGGAISPYVTATVIWPTHQIFLPDGERARIAS